MQLFKLCEIFHETTLEIYFKPKLPCAHKSVSFVTMICNLNFAFAKNYSYIVFDFIYIPTLMSECLPSSHNANTRKKRLSRHKKMETHFVLSELSEVSVCTHPGVYTFKNRNKQTPNHRTLCISYNLVIVCVCNVRKQIIFAKAAAKEQRSAVRRHNTNLTNTQTHRSDREQTPDEQYTSYTANTIALCINIKLVTCQINFGALI